MSLVSRSARAQAQRRVRSGDPLADAVHSALLESGVRAKPEFAGRHPLTGLCSVAAEAYLFLSGDRQVSGLTPVLLKQGQYHHWWLEDGATGAIIDITREQFRRPEKIPYHRGRRQWFGSVYPSQRAVSVIEWVREHRPETITRGEDRPAGRSRIRTSVDH